MPAAYHRGGSQSVLPRLLLVCALLYPLVAQAQWLSDERTYMGTLVTVELWADDALHARDVIDQVFSEFERLDQMMNPWNPVSELARINREAGTGTVTTTAELTTVIERALFYSRLTNGAFDISFASVGQHYNYRENTAPADPVIAGAIDKIDYRAIDLDPAERAIHFERAGMQIDLGGIAKGYAVDQAIALLQAAGIRDGAVSAGGDSRILGGKTRATAEGLTSQPRTVGIRHPRKEGEFAVLIPLDNTAISTSGDYERFFEQDGIRYHHILDPDTGRSASDVQSVSILAPRAIDSDALSTATFVLGIDKGLDLINRLDGIEGIIIDGSGKLHYSQGLLRSTSQ